MTDFKIKKLKILIPREVSDYLPLFITAAVKKDGRLMVSILSGSRYAK